VSNQPSHRCIEFIALLVAFQLLTGCDSPSEVSVPALSFSKVAAAYQEDPYNIEIAERDYKTGVVEGHVTGAQPGQRVAVYAKTDGRWGICRQSGQPFTSYDADGNWKATVHLGLQYAALLVDATYSPPEQTELLPTVGNGVGAVVVVDGEGATPTRAAANLLNFSDYQWIASTGPIFRAGSRNYFDPANAWTDESGALHLRISGTPGRWASAEVKLTRSLGYGTYRFWVRDISHFEPSAILTMVTWDGIGTESNRRELDIELGRWGQAENTNANYVVQPYYVPANLVAFRLPPGAYVHSLHWEPGKVELSTSSGSGNTAGATIINQHVFTSGVPTPGGETVRIALFIYLRGKIPLTKEHEVVIEKFEYLP
jgi:hypothetical protein